MFNHLFRAEEGLDCTSLENGNSKQLNSTGCTFKTVKHKQWTWRTTCCCFNTDAVTSPLQLCQLHQRLHLYKLMLCSQTQIKTTQTDWRFHSKSQSFQRWKNVRRNLGEMWTKDINNISFRNSGVIKSKHVQLKLFSQYQHHVTCLFSVKCLMLLSLPGLPWKRNLESQWEKFW